MRDEFHGGPWDGQSQVHISNPINTPYRRHPEKDRPGIIAWVHDSYSRTSSTEILISANSETIESRGKNIHGRDFTSTGKKLTLQDLENFVHLANINNIAKDSEIKGSLNFSGHLKYIEIDIKAN